MQLAYADIPFWREVIDRASRNAVQTLVPTLAVIATGTVGGFHPAEVGYAVAIAFLVTVVKAAASWHAGRGAPLPWRILDRVVPAGAAAALTWLTIDGTTPVASVDWQAAGTGVIGSMLLALVMGYTSPPVRSIQHEHAAQQIMGIEPDDAGRAAIRNVITLAVVAFAAAMFAAYLTVLGSFAQL